MPIGTIYNYIQYVLVHLTLSIFSNAFSLFGVPNDKSHCKAVLLDVPWYQINGNKILKKRVNDHMFLIIMLEECSVLVLLNLQ